MSLTVHQQRWKEFRLWYNWENWSATFISVRRNCLCQCGQSIEHMVYSFYWNYFLQKKILPAQSTVQCLGTAQVYMCILFSALPQTLFEVNDSAVQKGNIDCLYVKFILTCTTYSYYTNIQEPSYVCCSYAWSLMWVQWFFFRFTSSSHRGPQ